MAKKNSLLRIKDIRAGKTVWVVYLGKVLQANIKYLRYESYGIFFHFMDKDYERSLSVGDSGVIGAAYDARPCQIFRTKKAAHFWNNQWKALDVNPNRLSKCAYGN